MERSAYIRASPSSSTARLWRHDPTLLRNATACDALGRRNCTGSTRWQDRRSRSRDALSEPFSNITLSLGEDALAVFLTWFATRHPYWAAMISLAFVLVVVVLMRWVVRALRSMLRSARKKLDLIFNGV